ncbi:MAG: hypothetical protein IJI22_06100 [Bacilli bacterium]|nr:hypothetical protein [Bacilli bacterium]
MKWYKKLFISILFFILINLISAFIFSCNLKNVLIDGIIKETIKENIVRREENTGNFTIDEEKISELSEDERIQEILNSKEAQELMDKYLDLTVDGMLDEESLDEITIEEDLLNYLKENKELISEVVGEEVTDEMIDEAASGMETKEISNAIKKAIANNSRNLTTTEKTVLKGYKLFISLEFKLLILAIIIIDLFLIALLQKSYSKWIKTLASALITSGIFVLIASVVVKLIVSYLTGFINFNIISLIISGATTTVIGIIILIIYNLILNLTKKNEKEA